MSTGEGKRQDGGSGAPCVACVGAVARLAEAVAHELNQPLMAISANAAAALRRLRQEGDDGELGTMLADIVDQSQRAGALVQSLQTLAQRHAACSRVALHTLLRELPLHARAALARKGAAIAFDLAAPCDIVDGDPVQLRELLLELVHHALSAMAPAHGGGLRLTTRTLPGGWIEVRMDFSDPHDSAVDVESGAGLAVGRAIAQGHGGCLQVHAREAGACSISLTLPEAG